MRLGIFARTFESASPHRALEQAVTAGFTIVHYNFQCSGLPPMPDSISGKTVEDVRTAVNRTGAKLVALSGTYNMIHPDKAIREMGHRRLHVLAEAAAALGIPVITLCTGTRHCEDQWRHHPDNNTGDAWRDLVESMETAIEIAEDRGLALGIEPELGNVVNSAERARRLIDELQSPRIKIILDPANLFETATLATQRYIVARSIELLADRIVMGHAKDRTETGAFATAGQGVLDYPHYIDCMRAAGFDGPIVAHGLKASEARAVADFLSQQISEAGNRA